MLKNLPRYSQHANEKCNLYITIPFEIEMIAKIKKKGLGWGKKSKFPYNQLEGGK